MTPVLLMALTLMTCGEGVSHYRIITGSLSDHYLITHWAPLPRCGRFLWILSISVIYIPHIYQHSHSKGNFVVGPDQLLEGPSWRVWEKFIWDSSEDKCGGGFGMKIEQAICAFLKFRIDNQLKIEFQTMVNIFSAPFPFEAIHYMFIYFPIFQAWAMLNPLRACSLH